MAPEEERRRLPLLANRGQHRLDDHLVLEEEELRVEDLRRLFARLLGDPAAEKRHMLPRALEGAEEPFDFRLCLFGREVDVGDRNIGRVHEVDGADRDPGGGADPGEGDVRPGRPGRAQARGGGPGAMGRTGGRGRPGCGPSRTGIGNRHDHYSLTLGGFFSSL